MVELQRANLTRASNESKQRMSAVIKNWKKSKASVFYLKEGLRLLAEPDRPTAKQVSDEGPQEMVGVYCTFGKGQRPKVTLRHQEAQLLLDLLGELGARIEAEDELGRAVGIAAEALFDGKAVPSDVLRAELYAPLVKVLVDFDPRLRQLAFELGESV